MGTSNDSGVGRGIDSGTEASEFGYTREADAGLTVILQLLILRGATHSKVRCGPPVAVCL